MSLRIVAGEMGSRRIRTPPGRGTRPTPERVREAWFSALQSELAGSRVVDLFAGSGALGIEALSRGAPRADFVESDGRAAGVIEENLRRLGLEERGRVHRTGVFRFLAAPQEGGERYDVAFADPPYGGEAAVRLVRRYSSTPFARLLSLEHAAQQAAEVRAVSAPAWHREYGDTALSFFIPTEGVDGEHE